MTCFSEVPDSRNFVCDTPLRKEEQVFITPAIKYHFKYKEIIVKL